MTERVVIAGGGIAGTAAALALRTAGIDTTVVEARPDHTGGAVVRVNPNGMDALRAIGAHQAVIATSFPMIRGERFAPDGQRAWYHLPADPSSERGLPRVLAWSQLSQTLHDEAARAGAVFRHNTRVVDTKEIEDRVSAVLEDGETVEGDVLIGADGVWSTVRPRIDPDSPGPRRSVARTIYGFTPRPTFEPPPPEVLRAYLGRPFFAATRDSFTGGCYWFTSTPATDSLQPGEGTDTELWRGRLLDTFGRDTVPAAPAVEGADRILAFDNYALPHLPRWHTDRMLIIGDALHVAPPASEQGAAIAIEDGVVLAQCLRDLADPTAALAAFERRRRARVESIVALGLEGTRRAHARGLSQLARKTRDRLTALARRGRPQTGGPPWAYDHHIDWNERIKG